MKAVIFDLDGVLVFTDKFHYAAWKKLADSLGIYFDETINERLRGVSRMESLEIILERSDRQYSDEQKQKFADEKNELYRKMLATMTPDDVSKEVRTLLSDLRAAGIKVAVGSSSKNARTILQNTDLINSFHAVADGNCITRSKPDPEVFLKAAEMLEVAPCDCYVVEDAEAGILAAKAAGMKAIAIGPAGDCDQKDHFVSNISEVANIVLG